MSYSVCRARDTAAGSSRRGKPAERLTWAVDTMAVCPADRLLEIGSGHGVAVSLVCEKLDGGTIAALDRSATMVKAATKRNADYIDAGVASFQTASLHEADLGRSRYDKIFAIHVGLFLRGKPARELELIRNHLSPGGRLYLVYQPLEAGKAQETVETLTSVLDHHGFTVVEVLVHDLPAARVTCVIAEDRPS